MSTTTSDLDARRDAHLLDALIEKHHGAVTALHQQAVTDEWNGVPLAWHHWGEYTLAITREAKRLNDQGAWPEHLDTAARYKLGTRVQQVIDLATEHPETRDLHEVVILRATLRGLRVPRRV